MIDTLVGELYKPDIIAVENRSYKETYHLPPPMSFASINSTYDLWLIMHLIQKKKGQAQGPIPTME
ncbi:MAG: hypothetical protein OXI67_20760 [Candidatus Poribacteria bacterium]|nr:hypothetical protein [Candidatus Poribacteria bacterium]